MGYLVCGKGWTNLALIQNNPRWRRLQQWWRKSDIECQQIRTLLDANVWVSGLLWGGNPRKIIHLAEQERITLYTSLPLFEELEETLDYPKLKLRLQPLEITANNLLSEVRRLTQFCQPIPLPLIPELRDPKGKILLETALSVPVEAIVSGDTDLLILSEFHQIPILTVFNFLQRYSDDFNWGEAEVS